VINIRKLMIAIGNSRKAKKWFNESYTFTELCKRLSSTLYTAESMEEYEKMTKDERGEIKDKGGFVGGAVSSNRRTKETIRFRSLLTLDVDDAKRDFLDDYKAKCKYASCVYSTHSHKPSRPRLRIIIPLTRDINPDEFTAISRLYAAAWGIEQFDPCSYQIQQLMYWPTTPKNGEFIFEVIEGDWLDPDAFLQNYPSWKDYSTLPANAKEALNKKQQDPLLKDGIVGAFCRTYSITRAIETYLADVYEPSQIEGRYDYIPAQSTAGVVLYDDKFAYSHHASDPASGMLLNAFDLVRIHKFGDGETSFHDMYDLARNDGEVRIQLTNDRLDEARTEFDDWKKGLTYMKKSTLLENTTANLLLILNNDPDFKGFAYNEFANRVEVIGDLPWGRSPGNKFWRDVDSDQLKAIIDARYLPFSSRNHDVAFNKVADDRRFHPIRDYLDGLPAWDKVPRVETLFINYLDADDTPYVRTITRKAFAAAVARIYQPGIKFDNVLVLDGKQGIGKSTIVKDLVTPEYYSETLTLTDMDDKSSAEKIQGFWVVEIGELAGMKKAEIEKVKAFISTTDDKYRPSYGRVVESHPRQCIIIATVNGDRGYLRDITGNRRFWIIKVNQEEQLLKWNFTKEDRDQFWAEAKEIYRKGEKLYLEGEILAESEKAQMKAMEVDERKGMVEEYLNVMLPDNWDGMDLYKRRSYLAKDDLLSPTKEGTVQRMTVSNAEIWCECFGKSLSELKPSDSYAIAALMSQIPEWERTSQSKRIPIYGKQRLYSRWNNK
jgi:putative DNA primase/helicase